jgi:Fur family ferric uptake transcriptional regulator
MTASSPGRPLTAADPTAGATALRAHGLRVSAARRLVLQALYEADGPVSADAIAQGLDGQLPPSDLSSVYRNLETFEHVGLVEHVHLGHGPGLYALGDDTRGWAVCELCDRHIAVAGSALALVRAAVLDATGFDAGFSHFPIVGRCPECTDGGHNAHS